MQMDDITVEVAMQYTTGYHGNVMSFANNTTPMKVNTWARFAQLWRVINDYARKNKLLKDNEDNLTGEDVRIWQQLSQLYPNPQFEDKPRPNWGIVK